MNLYLAAVYTNSYRSGGGTLRRYMKLNDREKECVNAIPHLLESYHYIDSQRYVDAIRADGARVFLDSGAFSAYTLGATIDLKGYCDYIKRNLDIIRVDDGVVMASVLDGIGDPLQTYRNQLHMESLGVRPLPCFHAGEDERYLEHYIQNYDYITLGGMVGAGTDQLIKWLDRMWGEHLLDGSGKPRLKVHGFGVTSIPIMERYPWYSVDSSSWIQAAAFGSVFTAEHGAIAVSSQSPSRHDWGQHVSTLTDIEREYVLGILEKDGFDYTRLSTVYESRAAYNCLGYMKLNGFINDHIDRSAGVLDCHAIQHLF